MVVVDDGSQDSTSEIVGQFQDHHSNLRLVRLEINQGRGAARRAGQESTTTDLIGFVDADIVIPPDWLARCSSELLAFDAVSGIALPDGDCAVVWRISKPTLRRRPGSAEITGNNVLFSREALSRVSFDVDSQLGEDFRLAKLMVRKGLRLTTISDLVVAHRESKTYFEAVTWMWYSGIDATALLFEFRIVRIPDLAWLTWTVGVIVAVLLVATRFVGVFAALVAVAALTIMISCLFVGSRFVPRPRPLRFLFALVISPPLILSYLTGRCVGLFRRRGVSYDG